MRSVTWLLLLIPWCLQSGALAQPAAADGSPARLPETTTLRSKIKPAKGSSQESCKDCGRRAWRGWYSHESGAPLFADCSDAAHYPVLREADWDALDLAYRQARTSRSQSVMVRFEGSLVLRESAPGKAPTRQILVQSFRNTLPGHDCRGPIAATGTSHEVNH